MFQRNVINSDLDITVFQKSTYLHEKVLTLILQNAAGQPERQCHLGKRCKRKESTYADKMHLNGKGLFIKNFFENEVSSGPFGSGGRLLERLGQSVRLDS